MNIFEVMFPDYTTFLFSSQMNTNDFVMTFNEVRAIKSPSGAIYNPRQYIYINLINNLEERQTRLVRPFQDSIVGK